MKILITAPYREKEQRELLEKFGEVIYRPWKSQGRAYNESELLELLTETQADALITEHDDVSKKVIDAFPELEFIGVCRGTPSNVAVESARGHGIQVFNTPARNAQAVAEMFVSNVIMLLRNTIPGWQWLQSESWEKGAHTSYLQFKGNELAGKTIGMVGFGAVGQRIANMVENFPCKIQFHDPFIEPPKASHKKVAMDEVFQTSDIVSINLPVTKETIGLINGNLISKMKKDSIFVNTARAAVVDRMALLEVLENNRIRGAYLDVFDHEPPDETDYKLIHLPNVLATPHIAGATFEVEDHHSVIMNSNIINHFMGKKQYNKVK